jgi:hypothetical protein
MGIVTMFLSSFTVSIDIFFSKILLFNWCYITIFVIIFSMSSAHAVHI